MYSQSSTRLEKQQQQEAQNELNLNEGNCDFEVELVIDTERKAENDDVAQTNIIVPFMSERLIEFDRQKFELDRL